MSTATTSTLLRTVVSDDLDGLINVAVGKPAIQSSYSEWSQPGEAGMAVSGSLPEDLAFHTEREENPFWQLDLESIVPIDRIIIHNRIKMLQRRARQIRVEIATTLGDWFLVHAGYCAFGGGANGTPLALALQGEREARFIRISLASVDYLHLAQVEVYTKPDVFALSRYCQKHRLGNLFSIASSPGGAYYLEWQETIKTKEVVGLKISHSGRFGNLLLQYVNAIQLAKRTGLQFVQLGQHELFDVREPFEVDGLHVLPHAAPLPDDGYFLCGEFFNSDDFTPVLPPFLQFRAEDEAAVTETVQRYIVPHILSGIPVAGEEHPEDEITIHLRAGDIFGSDHPVTFGYRQPPLTFYTLVLERMMPLGIKRVRLVYEDRGNPCIGALEHWLNAMDIPFRTQSESLVADMSALINAPHLVFGHGTFGYAACRLSSPGSIKTVHYFEPELGGRYGCIPMIDDVFSVYDNRGRYIKAFEYGKPFGPDEGWRNTPEMRNLMLSYPQSYLSLHRLNASTRSA